MQEAPQEGEVNEDAVIYQLEKVDQGGAIADLFEERIPLVAEAFGLEIDEDEESKGFGDIILPGNRRASMRFEAFIYDMEDDAKT